MSRASPVMNCAATWPRSLRSCASRRAARIAFRCCLMSRVFWVAMLDLVLLGGGGGLRLLADIEALASHTAGVLVQRISYELALVAGEVDFTRVGRLLDAVEAGLDPLRSAGKRTEQHDDLKRRN